MPHSAPPGPPDDEPVASRRGFLGGTSVALGVGLAATVLGPAAVFFGHPLGHATTSGSEDYIPAGAPKLFAGDAPVRVDLYADKVDAWNRVVQVKVGSAWVLREGGQLLALSTVCPHLGCGVDWDANANKFYCACHKSWFTRDGKVEDGPSPRAMDQLETKQDETLVAIRYQRFKLGVEAKEPIG
ncbi:MAG TPA: Rieske 2Fe-2S domain-containing protein [Nannocystaceae bacterium]|nr:Rieske 2Fe-2S domain-containing protein [Nannocystaceae bacterium]